MLAQYGFEVGRGDEAGNQRAIFENDRRRAGNADLQAGGEVFADDVGAVATRVGQRLVSFGEQERGEAVGRTPHLRHPQRCDGFGAAAREGEVAHGDALFVVLGDVFVQQLAVVAGGVEEDGDGVFFVLGREDDHLVFQRFQFAEERCVAEVNWLAFVGQLHQAALQVVFAVFGGIENALFGDDAAHSGDGAVADFHAFQAEVVQFFADDGVIGVSAGGQGEQGQGYGFFHVFLCCGERARIIAHRFLRARCVFVWRRLNLPV